MPVGVRKSNILVVGFPLPLSGAPCRQRPVSLGLVPSSIPRCTLFRPAVSMERGVVERGSSHSEQCYSVYIPSVYTLCHMPHIGRYVFPPSAGSGRSPGPRCGALVFVVVLCVDCHPSWWCVPCVLVCAVHGRRRRPSWALTFSAP